MGWVASKGLETVAKQGGQLPAGEGADDVDQKQEDRWRDPAGLGHGDDRRHLKGHTGIHQRYLRPLGQGTCGGAEGNLVDTRVAPQEHRADMRGNGRPWADGQDVRPRWWQRLGSRTVIHRNASISTKC
jgi:hypothetical protein